MKKITIDPITRLEGHGRIDIFLDDEGEVANASTTFKIRSTGGGQPGIKYSTSTVWANVFTVS